MPGPLTASKEQIGYFYTPEFSIECGRTLRGSHLETNEFSFKEVRTAQGQIIAEDLGALTIRSSTTIEARYWGAFAAISVECKFD